MINRRHLIGLSAASLGLFGRAAFAQAWPARFVRLIVPFVPGGATDVIARMVGNRLSELWGQQVVIENRAGAASNIGAQAAIDEATLLVGGARHLSTVESMAERVVLGDLA